ncbi:hypothetical protein [Rhodococcus sp. CH91]|nr:hypothetical protein [Rhodococcus sp. CH91]
MTNEPPPAGTSRPRRLGEDWAAVVAGLALIAAVLTGILPGGLVP